MGARLHIVPSVAKRLSAAPFVFTTGRTVVIPPKRPELRRDNAGAKSPSGMLAIIRNLNRSPSFGRTCQLPFIMPGVVFELKAVIGCNKRTSFNEHSRHDSGIASIVFGAVTRDCHAPIGDIPLVIPLFLRLRAVL